MSAKGQWRGVMRRTSSLLSVGRSLNDSDTESSTGHKSRTPPLVIPVIIPPAPSKPSPIAESPAREAAATDLPPVPVGPSPLPESLTESHVQQPRDSSASPSSSDYGSPTYVPPPLVDAEVAGLGPGAFTEAINDLLPPTVNIDPSIRQIDPVDGHISDVREAPSNGPEGSTCEGAGDSSFDLSVAQTSTPRDAGVPSGSLDIRVPLEASSPGGGSTSHHVGSNPSLVIKGPFHYTFSIYSNDHSTRCNNIDFSLDKTIDNGVYLSRVSMPSESLFPSLSAIMETGKMIASDSSESLLTHSEKLYQALQAAHNILWRLSEQLADILHKDDPLRHLDEFLAELADIFKDQGIRILGAISNLYPAFLGNSGNLRYLGHKAIDEVVTEYTAWQDSVAALVMAVEAEEHQLYIACPSEEQVRQGPLLGNVKEGLLPSLSATPGSKEQKLSYHTHSQGLRAANHTVWKLSTALVDVSCGSDPLSGLDKLSVDFAEAIKVEGSSILNSINVLYRALSSAKTPTHLRREFMIRALDEYKAWQENVKALLKAIREEGSRLSASKLSEGVADAAADERIQATSSPVIGENRSKAALQVLQAANLSMWKLLGEIVEVMEKDGTLGDLDTVLTRSADSIKIEGVRIVTSIGDLYLAPSLVGDGGKSHDAPYEAFKEVVPKLMAWKGNVVTLLDEFQVEGDRLKGLGKLSSNEQGQVLPVHAEDHAKALSRTLQDAGETLWKLSEQLSSTSDPLELEKLSTNFAASVKVEGVRILGSINDVYLALASGESSHYLRRRVLTEAVTDYLAWQDDVVIYLEAIGIRSSNLTMHEAPESAIQEQAQPSPSCKDVMGGDEGPEARLPTEEVVPRCRRGAGPML